MSFNKIIIVGNLGRDPELRYTPQGTPVCTFSVATSERRKSREGDQEEITTWFRVQVWGRQADSAAQYLMKGRQVYVEGRLRLEEWQDREGKQRYTLNVNATDVKFIDRGSGDGRQEQLYEQRGASNATLPGNDLSDDAIPF